MSSRDASEASLSAAADSRAMSVSMARNFGLTALPGWANTVVGSFVPAHSSPMSSTCTEKDMSVSRHAIPTCSNSAIRFGYVRGLKTMKPMSTG